MDVKETSGVEVEETIEVTPPKKQPKKSQDAKDRYAAAQEAAALPPSPYEAMADAEEAEVLNDLIEAQVFEKPKKKRKRKSLKELANRSEKSSISFKPDFLSIHPKPGQAREFTFRPINPDRVNYRLNHGWIFAQKEDFVDDGRCPTSVKRDDGSNCVMRNEMVIMKLPHEHVAAYNRWVKGKTANQTSSIVDKAIHLGAKRAPGGMGGGEKAKIIFPGETVPRSITKRDREEIEEIFNDEFKN